MNDRHVYWRKIIAANLRATIKSKRARLKNLAPPCGFTYKSLSTWLRGTSGVRADVLAVLAEELGVPVASLFDEKNQNTNKDT